MTENEAIKVINDKYETFFALSTTNDFDMAMATAIQALEEIQQYRAIGTVEDIQLIFSLCKDLERMVKKYEAIGTVEEIQSMKDNGAFSGIELAQLAAIQTKLKDYQEIGTVKEFKTLKEKSEPKKPIRKPNADMTHEEVSCPSCGRYVSDYTNEVYCNCGQKLDWE